MWQPAPVRPQKPRHRRGFAPRAVFVTLLLLAGAACKESPREDVRIVPQLNPARPRRVAFAPDREDRLLVLESTGLIGVWDIRDPKQPVRTAWIPAGAIDASFAPDGTEIVTAGWDGKVRWWTPGGRLLRTSAGGHNGAARALAVGNDRVVSGGEDGALRLWDRDGTERGEPIAAHEGFVVSVAIRPNGDLVSAGTDEAIRLWQKDSSSPSGYRSDVLQREERSRRRAQLKDLIGMDVHMGWDHALALSPRGDALAAASFDGVVWFWGGTDWNAPKALTAVPGQHQVRAVAWAPGGATFAAAGFDGLVELWNADGSRRGKVAQQATPLLSVAFSPGGDRFATASIDNRVRLWGLDGTLVAELPAAGTTLVTMTVGLTAAGPLFASADGTSKIWQWRIDGSPAVERSADAIALAFSPNAERLVAGGGHGTVWVYGDEVTTTATSRFNTYVDEVAVSPRGDVVAIAGNPGKVELLNADASPRTAPFKTCNESILGFAFSPVDPDVLAALCDDGAVKLWTLDGKPRGSLLEVSSGAARGLAMSSSAQLLASGRLDGAVDFWALPSRRLDDDDLFVGLSIEQVGFHRDGWWVTANGNTVLFFDGARRLIATAVATAEGVVAFTPDGSFAGSRGGERLARAIGPAGTPLSAAETAKRLSPVKVAAALGGSIAAVADRAIRDGDDVPAADAPAIDVGEAGSDAQPAASATAPAAPPPTPLPLIAAARAGDRDGVKRLLDGGADPNAKDSTGVTPLIAAADGGNAEVVKVLLEARADPNAKDQAGATPLLRAAGGGHMVVVVALLGAGADPNASNDKGWNALMEAAFHDRTEVVELLLSKGAPVDGKDASGATAFYRAAGNGHLPTMKTLLAAGADVKAADSRGVTPLIVAAFQGRTEAVRTLLKSGADLNARDAEGSNALAAAAAGGHTAVVEVLLTAGEPVDAPGPDGATALMLAAADAHLETIRFLLDHGANVNAAANEGTTALHAAAQEGSVEPVRLLLERGADVTAMNDDGETALQLAKQWSEHDDTVDLLQKALAQKKRSRPKQ